MNTSGERIGARALEQTQVFEPQAPDGEYRSSQQMRVIADRETRIARSQHLERSVWYAADTGR